MWKTCAQSHRFGLGRVGGGIPLGGGGVGEPRNRDHIYTYVRIRKLSTLQVGFRSCALQHSRVKD